MNIYIKSLMYFISTTSQSNVPDLIIEIIIYGENDNF